MRAIAAGSIVGPTSLSTSRRTGDCRQAPRGPCRSARPSRCRPSRTLLGVRGAPAASPCRPRRRAADVAHRVGEPVGLAAADDVGADDAVRRRTAPAPACRSRGPGATGRARRPARAGSPRRPTPSTPCGAGRARRGIARGSGAVRVMVSAPSVDNASLSIIGEPIMLKGKTALVTGSTSGIGLGIAQVRWRARAPTSCSTASATSRRRKAEVAALRRARSATTAPT